MRSVRAAGLGQGLGDDGTLSGISFGARAEAVNALFQQQLMGLRCRFRAWEIPAIVRHLQEQRDLSIRLLREQHEAEQSGARDLRQRRRLPPASQPAG